MSARARARREVPIAGLVGIATFGVLLPFLLLTAVALSIWVEERHTEDMSQVRRSAETLAKAVDRELRGYVESAELLAASRHLQWGDLKVMDEIARDAAAKLGGRVVVTDRQLQHRVDTGAEAGASPAGSPLPSLNLAFEAGRPLVGNLSVEPGKSRHTFAIHVPVTVDGEVRYVLSYTPPADAIVDVLRQTIRPQGWLASVLDGEGRLVARSEAHEAFVGKSASAAFMAQMRGASGLVESVDLQGRQSVTGHHALVTSGWHAVVWAPKQAIESPRVTALRLMLTMTAATLLASLAAAWLTGRAITMPARELVLAAKALGAGRPVDFRSTIMREANIVGEMLADSARSIAAREDELRESEARFRNMADQAPVMIWVTEPDGAASFLSATWYEFTGQSPRAALGFGWLDAVHPEDRERSRETFEIANQAQAGFRLEYRLRRADGTYRWAIDAACPRYGRDGVFRGYIGSVLDITDSKRATAALRDSEDLARRQLEEIETIYASAHIGLCVFDRDLRFQRVNRLLADMNGLPVADHIGKTAREVVPALADAVENVAAEVFRTGKGVTDVEFRGSTPAQPGVERAWVQQWLPLRDGAGSIVGINVVVEEVTERRRFEEALRHSEEEKRLALEAGLMGVWSWRLDGRPSEIDDRTLELFGVGREEWSGDPKVLIDRIHADDRLAVRAAIDDAVRGQQQYRIEFRVGRGEDEVRWLAGRGRTELDPAGRAIVLRGVTYDISERKRREEQIVLLMREVNHRSKNMLGLVLAVARQTVAHSPNDFLSRFTERVQALSASQDLLVRNDWQGADMHELARAQLAHFKDLVGTRIALSGPELRLAPSAAQSIGMALHELSTNAGKYGALSNSTGNVDIGWATEGGSDPQFVLTWRERGGPSVTVPAVGGFGSTVIGTMVKLGLGGDVTLDYAETGLNWRLSCSAKIALESGWQNSNTSNSFGSG